MDIIFSILIISFLIFIHELGHFLVARKSGMAVEEFGFGMPPKIFGKKYGDTVYSINLIPFGGFVRIKGESAAGNSYDADAFLGRPAWQRLFVVLAGVFMNFLLGFSIFWGLFTVGTDVALDQSNRALAKNLSIGVLEVAKDSPAFTAGLKPGDRIYKLSSDDQIFTDFNEGKFIELTKQFAGQEISLSLIDKEDVLVVPRIDPPQGEGSLGIAIAQIGTVKYPITTAFSRALDHSFSASVFMFEAAGNVLKNAFFKGDIQNLSGPIGIVNMTASSLDAGFSQTLGFMALISLNLAVFNLLPLPALDGGRIVFVLWEMISKKPVPQKYETWVHSIGMFLLLGLLLLVTIGDLKRLF
ncbi:MAG: hypothetical protein A2418_00910 [Candidatus Brennerbacteria bacterium RIFOXYC1_FULL_41_11]|uniref:Peptidase M50 domain-containing protein n=1 Tax=Candidatus Brennerbacteria bacterium RIFOXYD1_FULL_41_16 TaxID=1797529 RepID=A0A1G1XLW4_9BACT|nr:MAG: Membrane-associated zinc metalloprotease [Parcubacteria group bacterium GW2011_GWB1_41_4]OGY38598.1 MAG: hypothetical protein A2391_03340 [Candidatus Brennerbacteria bacterium RIFOXYB1_FULL_41_13]OGY38862.1 MAG: hypothetical protein A2418_00910 [Candidatus Brennerbacteria bacterium RIFOXYC1_FULL_41_11]OGY41019.1 MAG: hypothetical protein A2570_00035 [Candidatus Brennerbacteria bacterium RIFOXYD1_FULL_41_16]